MNKMKIRMISLLNFKGFDKLQLSFDSEDAIILGGKNGYGKTTLFDALELLFTGRIQRMIDYKDYHNNRYGISQEEKPLVFNKHSDFVIVSAEIEQGDARVVLQRKAKVSDMKNPVDFKAFGKLQIVEDDGTERELSDEDSKHLCITELCESYGFLNYLSQEEATTFLKQKEADRAEMLSQLFDLNKYEMLIKKIKSVQKTLISLKKYWSEEKNKNETYIQRLKTSNSNDKDNDIKYVQIASDQSKLTWDKESSNLTFEDFNALLEEGGILDRLSYLCRNIAEYKKYKRNAYIEQHSSENEVYNLALYAKYFSKEAEIKLYLEFQNRVVQPLRFLTFTGIEGFVLDIPNELKRYFSNEILEKIDSKIKLLQSNYEIFDDIQKSQVLILEMRNNIEKEIRASLEYMQQCPLCGHSYATSEELLKKIDEHGNFLKKYTKETFENTQKMFDILKKELQALIFSPILEHFKKEKITESVCQEYKKMHVESVSKTLDKLIDKFDIYINDTLEIDAMVESIRLQLKSAIKECDNTLDYNDMNQTYSSYGRYVKKEFLTEEAIQRKRAYLTSLWNKSKSEQLVSYEREKTQVVKILANIDKRTKEFKCLLKDVENSEKAYLGKLLSDIKILFYIYSGRIMQDNYFGRGLFIRENLDKNRVLITSSKSEHDEVDALFNMSSGQLVSLVIALTLSLNKLYSSIPFIAIDDPIQTMDDINLWGLIETLRHDFSDHFLLLSTHETDYGKLLEYKLKKWGMDTEYIEMSQLHRK
mgnify:CR=1 FL=1